MSTWLLVLVSLIYAYVTLELFIKGNLVWAFVYFGYSIAGFASAYLIHRGIA